MISQPIITINNGYDDDNNCNHNYKIKIMIIIMMIIIIIIIIIKLHFCCIHLATGSSLLLLS